MGSRVAFVRARLRLSGAKLLICHSEEPRDEESAFRFGAKLGRTHYVYILSSRSRNLYTGVTNNLFRRIVEHKKGLVPGFTLRYRIHRLVHFESFIDVREAIAREKQIKGWDRKKRIALIERANPAWGDLAEGWLAKQKANAGPSPHGGSG